MLIKAGVPPCFSRNARVDYFTQPCFDFYKTVLPMCCRKTTFLSLWLISSVLLLGWMTNQAVSQSNSTQSLSRKYDPIRPIFKFGLADDRDRLRSAFDEMETTAIQATCQNRFPNRPRHQNTDRQAARTSIRYHRTTAQRADQVQPSWRAADGTGGPSPVKIE